MKGPEGIIKFKQDFTEEVFLIPEEVETIGRLRRSLFEMGLIGVYPGDHPLFPGVGYGNASQRVGKGTGFLITGSATGGLRAPGPSHYALVEHYDIQGNYVMSRGGTPASSESLTHAAVYSSAPDAKFVAHVHHPGLWEKREELGLTRTSERAEYGTPRMASEISRLITEQGVGPGTVVAMGGHRDGLICWSVDWEVLPGAFKKLLDDL